MFSLAYRLAFLLALSPIVHAEEGPAIPLDLDKLRIEQQQLLAEVEAAREPYDRMPRQRRTDLIGHQRRVLALLEGKASTAELTPDEHMAIFNSLEAINATVTKAEDDRLICTREKRKGSHLTVRVCKTAAQMRQERDAAKELLDRPGCLSKQACSGGPR